MIKIGICEDEELQLRFLERELAAYCEQTGEKIEIKSFVSAEELLFKHENAFPFDCLLLDIRLQRMDGMALAERIRRTDKDIAIIFVTGDRDAVFDGYKVGAVRYILKPVKRQELFEAIDFVRRRDTDARKGAQAAGVDYYCFSYCGESVKIDRAQILYIEVKGHYIYIHVCCGESEQVYSFKETLGGIRESIADSRLVPANRSTLVNIARVCAITRQECVLDTSARIPVSRGCYAGLNQAFLRYLT